VFEALVFNTDRMDNETIPRYVSYKIRMDIDRVDSTAKFKVTDRYMYVYFICMLYFFCLIVFLVSVSVLFDYAVSIRVVCNCNM